MSDPEWGRQFVVIGGGPAGLTAAYELTKHDHRPVVLEKYHLVGGIARTENDKGYHFDMGGNRFFTKSEEVDAMRREVLRRPRLPRIFHKSKFFNYPLKPFNALAGLGLVESILIILGYTRWQLFPYREVDTFEQWVTNRFGREQSSTFWAGCGAVRRSAFEGVGGFDASFTRPCIEDIELGVRLREAGHRIELNKAIQVKHLKKWTLWGMLRADVRDRAIPWTELILRQHHMPDDLNLRFSQRVCTILAFALLGMLILGAWFYHGLLLLPFLSLLGLVMVDYWSTYDRIPTAFRVMAVLVLLGVVGAISFYFKMWTLVVLALLLGIVLINLRFYRFFAQERHPLFAAVVVPLHVLYYVYCGASFALGLWLHVWRKRLRSGSAGLHGPEAPRAAEAGR